MKFAVLSNVKGQIVLVHEEPAPHPIEWIEYIPAEDHFSIVFDNGEYFVSDLDFSYDMKQNLKNGDQVVVQHISADDVISSSIVSILIQEF